MYEESFKCALLFDDEQILPRQTASPQTFLETLQTEE